LQSIGVRLIATDSPDTFVDDGPTATMVRQILAAVSQFEKAGLVAKLKAARDRRLEKGIKCGGRKSLAERDPKAVELARRLAKARNVSARHRGRIGRRRLSVGERQALCGDRS
jgi:DNA invertase Pin-like site-specific DNA recombinase